MPDYTLAEVEARIGENIPALSPTAAKVIRLANDINCPPGELTKVIKLDPVLSAKVLKLVNSSYFSLSAKVASLEKAIILAGLNTIKNLALAAAVLAQMEAKSGVYAVDITDFWTHSLAVGVAAKAIALRRQVPRQAAEDYFTAGLLHDLGLLVENKLYPAEMRKILCTSSYVGLLYAEEMELRGMNHCQVGRLLAQRWGLSPDLAEVFARHHNPCCEGEHTELILTVYLANILCKNEGVGLVIDAVPIEVPAEVYARLGLDETIRDEVLALLPGELRKAMEILKA